MKKFILLLFCFFTLFLQAENYKVLFIGNSYTAVNNLPQLVHDVLGISQDEYTMSSNTPSGCTFKQHLNNQSASLIKQGGWDFVILQEQSQQPSFPYAQFDTVTYRYSIELCELIRQYNPNAQIIFYMTWGRQNGDAGNCQYYPPLCTYEGMDSLLRARYMLMAEDNNAVVSPVGALWHYIRVHHPDIQLYQSDESHPSLIGSYAAACSFYTILTQNNPIQIENNCGVDASIAQIIRNCAQTVVYDSLDKWMFAAPYNPGVSSYETAPITLYPNPATQTLSVDLSKVRTKVYDVRIFDATGTLCGEVFNGTGKHFDYDVSTLKSGMYLFVVYSDGKQIASKKFLKK